MTTTKDMIPSNGTVILKQDGKGRVRTPAARREELLDEFEHSGLSGPKFAALAGIKYQTFASWVLKRKRKRTTVPAPQDAATTAGKMKWLEAVVESAHNPAMSVAGTLLVLQLPGGVQLEVADERQVALAARLVQALAKSC